MQWGSLIEGDVRDEQRLIRALQETRPQAVLHFAGKILVGESVARPDLYFDHNVTGTQRLLEACRATGVNNVVFSSSCAVYGVPQSIPLTEDHPCLPAQPYGVTKRVAELMLESYGHAFGMKSVALRYFNAAGADPDGQLGEAHDPETHLIPCLLRAALTPSRQVTIHGGDYPTPDGTCVRDYVHVSDLARAHVAAVQRIEQLPNPFEAFNLCAEQGMSNLEMVRTVENVLGRSLEVQIGPRRSGDVAVLRGLAEKAKTYLDWTPTRSDPETLVRTAWEWEKRHVA